MSGKPASSLASRVADARWRRYALPQLIDQVAREDPDSVYASWPVVPNSYSAGVRHITYAQLANIVNGLAGWIVKEIGPGDQSQALAYVGPNDVRFTALIFAGMKTGHRIFLTSPRNSLIAHRKLFSAVGCKTLITSDPATPHVHAILEGVESCRALTIASVDDLLSTTHRVYVMEKALNAPLRDALNIVHTSGSTGIPKPLIWTQETAMRHIEAISRDPPDGQISVDSFMRGKRLLSTLPPFHGAGLMQHLLYATAFGNIINIPAATGPIVTAQGVVDALKQTPADVVIMVPSVVAELSESPDLLEYCAKNIQLILYIGGDLPQAVGDRVASKVRLRCWWGASEIGFPQQVFVPELESSAAGWHYIRFGPIVGARFDLVNDNLYELVICRDEKLVETQTTFTIGGFENFTEYRTKDLFEPHPDVPDAWRWRARADDIIVFLNGEKTNPVSMEQQIVTRNPGLISGAIVVGAQRFEAALIIEPVGTGGSLSTAEQAALIEKVWPSVDEANRSAPAHARIDKSLILVATQPFIRSGKGTIQRAANVVQYTDDVDKLYANADVSAASALTTDATDVNALMRLIQDTLRSMEGVSGTDENTNFFDSGMDSLRALQLVRVLRKAVGSPKLALSTVYQNPTPRQLATAIASNSSDRFDQKIRDQLLDTYRGLLHEIPKLPGTTSTEEEGPVDVLLTGSTGTLGTSILAALLYNPKIRHIFCLNRAEDGGREAQFKRFAAANLETDTIDCRVKFLHADLTDPKLGLTETTYADLCSRVKIVIHNAWPVNFNLNLLAFRPLLAGLVNLFKFAASAAPRTIRTFFVSSVSAVTGLSTGAPEEIVPDDSKLLPSSLANGYAGSKRLAELLCDSAARHIGIPVAVLRIGQVAGSTAPGGTIWNRSEWLPSLVVSSILRLNCLPDNLGPQFSNVDWVPSDLLGMVISELVLAGADTAHGDGAEVFNVRNPNTVLWNVLIPTIEGISRERSDKEAMQIVSPETWLEVLQETAETDENEAGAGLMSLVAKNPALKLVDFYRESLWPRHSENAQTQLPMDVTRAVAASDTLHKMPPVSSEWMRKWVKEWLKDIDLVTTSPL
ncbi:putative NRPS-like enzyme [Xylaria bambusicola]|uniref:putative NRPS-like enzyme n=1 Tax=Xylaria bambusicola TaxID=326684 RepID=UPI0020084557|nr:putative NRPS-like enzyme [Xylaria bambusicola]KAI0517475.1 putative NRPS-like enzyme [Xylaria bambusicola]